LFAEKNLNSWPEFPILRESYRNNKTVNSVLMDYTERTELLSVDDIRSLKKKSKKMKTALIGFMIFGLLCGFLAKLMSDTYVPMIAVLIMIVIPICIILFYFSNFSKNDVKSGFKKVIAGPISDKLINTTETQNIGQTENTTRTTVYSFFYFQIGPHKISVTEDIFNTFETDDLVEVHLTASGVILNIIAKSPSGAVLSESLNYEVEPMNDEDLVKFKDIRTAILKRTLGVSLIFGFIAYWIILVAFVVIFTLLHVTDQDTLTSWISWLLILAVLFVIWMANKKTWVPLILDGKEKMKRKECVNITDKLISDRDLRGNYISMSSSKGWCYFKYKERQLPVGESLFDKMNIGDEVVCYSTLHGQAVLKVNELKG
jgi:hypothetical protein